MANGTTLIGASRSASVVITEARTLLCKHGGGDPRQGHPMDFHILNTNPYIFIRLQVGDGDASAGHTGARRIRRHQCQGCRHCRPGGYSASDCVWYLPTHPLHPHTAPWNLFPTAPADSSIEAVVMAGPIGRLLARRTAQVITSGALAPITPLMTASRKGTKQNLRRK